MTPTVFESLPQFWLYGVGVIFALTLIIGVEVYYVWRSRHFDLHRVPHLFNIFILLLLVFATYYGMQRFEDHRDRFESTSLSYPRASYKAERQSLEFGDDWVYVTDDTPETVIAFYETQAETSRYNVIVDTTTSTPRLLFQRNDTRLFLTIINEEDERVLHYGKEGSVQTITY